MVVQVKSSSDDMDSHNTPENSVNKLKLKVNQKNN